MRNRFDDTMKLAILAVSLLSTASAFAADPEQTIGKPGFLVINPHPIA